MAAPKRIDIEATQGTDNVWTFDLDDLSNPSLSLTGWAFTFKASLTASASPFLTLTDGAGTAVTNGPQREITVTTTETDFDSVSFAGTERLTIRVPYTMNATKATETAPIAYGYITVYRKSAA
jgi:hypothetical protein